MLAIFIGGAKAENIKSFLNAEDYRAAARLEHTETSNLVRNAEIIPYWIDGEDLFWYIRASDTGPNIVIIDAASGARSNAYDIALMSTALKKIDTQATDSVAASPIKLTGKKDLMEAEFNIGGKTVICQILQYECRLSQQVIKPRNSLVAPNGKMETFVRDHNIWVRDLNTKTETPLTIDGEVYAGYGAIGSYYRLRELRFGFDKSPLPLFTHWSPDSRWLITRKLDEREVESYAFVESVPRGGGFRPKIHEVRTPLLGDGKQPKIDYVIINIANGSKHNIALPEGFDLEDFSTYNQPLGWNDNSNKFYLYASSGNGQNGRVLEVDIKTGRTRGILEENAPGSRVNLSSSLSTQHNIRIIGKEIVWYSQRDNWGHLYRYDIEKGVLKKPLTKRNWNVHAIVHVDQDRRSLIISASGKENGSDPYLQSLYRISLDGGEPVLLTPEVAHHKVAPNGISPSGTYMVQSFSTISDAPHTVLRHIWNFPLTIKLETADASALYASGWQAPQRLRVKAADNATDLYAVVFSPDRTFNDFKKLPVLDSNYMNSIISITPVDFMEAVRVPSAESMARPDFFKVAVASAGSHDYMSLPPSGVNFLVFLFMKTAKRSVRIRDQFQKIILDLIMLHWQENWKDIFYWHMPIWIMQLYLRLL